MQSDQKLMGIQEFGDRLIATRDLDPLYVGLVGARLEPDQLARYLLAYWCFYHVGAAAFLSENEGNSFWVWMQVAARNRPEDSPQQILPWEEKQRAFMPSRWPRAAERRHFRGEKCVKAVEWFSNRAPEWWVLLLAGLTTDKAVMNYVQTWPMFGPWIAFKAADMMERVWGTKVQFDPNLGLMYHEPRAALELLPQHNPTWTDPTPRNLYDKLITYFSARRAPPFGDRPCGPQEVETVLCKYKSYLGGHYYLGKDIKEQRGALMGWGKTADRILAAYPAEVME